MAQAISSRYGHFDDLVFDARNKSYGAYKIRKQYTINALIGFGVAMLIVVALIVGPMIAAWINSMKPKKEQKKEVVVQMTLSNPESLDEEEKEEVKEVKQQEIKQESVKFTAPVITDKPVDEIITDDDVEFSNPGKVTQDGVQGDFQGIPDGGGGDDLIGDTETDEEFTIVEQYPSFPGGDEAWFAYLDANIQYPQQAREQGIQGKVYLEFVVDKFGKVSEVKVKRGIGGGCDEEAVRVVSNSPRWNPAKQGGRAVRCRFTFPINFTLSGH